MQPRAPTAPLRLPRPALRRPPGSSARSMSTWSSGCSTARRAAPGTPRSLTAQGGGLVILADSDLVGTDDRRDRPDPQDRRRSAAAARRANEPHGPGRLRVTAGRLLGLTSNTGASATMRTPGPRRRRDQRAGQSARERHAGAGLVPRFDLEAWSPGSASTCNADLRPRGRIGAITASASIYVALRTAELVIGRRTFRNVTLGASRTEAGGFDANVVSDGVVGYIGWRPGPVGSTGGASLGTRHRATVQARHRGEQEGRRRRRAAGADPPVPGIRSLDRQLRTRPDASTAGSSSSAANSGRCRGCLAAEPPRCHQSRHEGRARTAIGRPAPPARGACGSPSTLDTMRRRRDAGTVRHSRGRLARTRQARRQARVDRFAARNRLRRRWRHAEPARRRWTLHARSTTAAPAGC